VIGRCVSASYQLVHASRQLAFASLGFVSLGLPEGLLGVAWPSIRASFNLPLDALGLLFATFATGYFVSSAASGRLIGRFSIGSVLAVSCALTGSCLLGYSLTPSWATMVALGLLLGLGAGTIDAGLNTYAAVAHGPRVLNWMHAAFGIGAAVGPLIMTAILASGLSWNVGYILVAAAQLSLATAYWLTRHAYATPDAEPASATEQPPAAVAAPEAPGSVSASVYTPQATDAPGPSSTNPQSPEVAPSGVSAPEPSAAERERAQRSGTAVILALSLAIFFVYVGLEAGAGQWSYSLFTLSRTTPAAVAGILISAYWTSLTLGRVLFGALSSRISSVTLLRAVMLLSIAASALIWLNLPPLSWLALALLGLSFAPVFPVLIAETPGRLGQEQAANAIGLEVAAAVVGGAALPATLGVLAARLTLEVVPPALLVGVLALLVLHELLVRSDPSRAQP
jgi:fucose permease